MNTFKVEPLSSAAKEVLGQLFLNGPTWDGNIVSKSGRDDLCRAGLAWHERGWAFLTREGVLLAVEWKDFHKPLTKWSESWLRKAGGA